jgi:glutamate 5-kinase
MGYNYNGKLRSAELLLKEDGSVALIRRAETPEDYFATADFRLARCEDCHTNEKEGCAFMNGKKRIVVKVGTSTLCHGGRGLNFRNIERLARTLADIRNAGHEVILVSSGAIGAGCGKLNLPERPTDLRVKQAVAAVGQSELMHIYGKYFEEYGATVGQILLTKDDVDRPTVKQNLLGTFLSLLELGVIPVVNENDSVCIEEIESEHKIFGDNDMLSAVRRRLTDADLLVILSDIDGLYYGDPR